MTPREKIEKMRLLYTEAQGQPVSVQIDPSGKVAIHTSVKSFEAWTMAEKALPALLNVAEAAAHYINTVEIEEGQAHALLDLRRSLAKLMTAPFWIEKENE